MANSSANVVLRALVGHVLTDLMVKTTGDRVYLNDTTTVSSKIAEIVATLNSKAKSADVNSQITEVKNLITALRQEMLGDTPVEAYNTFTELAKYIEEHKDISEALTEAIGQKVDVDELDAIENTIAGIIDNKAEKATVTSLQSSVNSLITTKADQTTVTALTNKVNSMGALSGKSEISASDLNDDLETKIAQISTNTNDISTLKTDKVDSTTLTEQINIVKGLVSDLRQEILGDTPVEAFNTFTELAKYISEHANVANALTEAIGSKANQSAVDNILAELETFGAIATKDVISESDLSAELQAKINTEGEHVHTNKTVLDGITESKVTAWNGKSTLHISKDTPTAMAANDMWFHII